MTAEVVAKNSNAKSELNLAHFTEYCHRYHDVVLDFDKDGTATNSSLQCADCGSHRVERAVETE